MIFGSRPQIIEGTNVLLRMYGTGMILNFLCLLHLTQCIFLLLVLFIFEFNQKYVDTKSF